MVLWQCFQNFRICVCAHLCVCEHRTWHFFTVKSQPRSVKPAFDSHLNLYKQMSEKQLNLHLLQIKKNKKHQVAHCVCCQLEYRGESLSPFTYKCHLLSSQGLGKVLLSSPWCAWQTFLPCLAEKLVMHNEKVRGDSVYFASSVFTVFCFSFTRCWYAVICVSKVKFTGFVSILLSFHTAYWMCHYFR